jgi:prepilin peptidase CpaA
MVIDPVTALIFLPFVFAIGVWVAWNDMKFMKIPNKAVMALLAVFVVVGLIALPFWDYLLRYLHIIVVLAIGFVANMGRLMGAGDAKFLAAMAPFFDRSDALNMVIIFAGVLLGAFATHRLFRAIPAMRRGFPDWQSWAHPKFPMGLALSGVLIIYLVLGAVSGGRVPAV